MKKQSKVAGLQRRKAISGYLFIAPFIIGFLAFMVKPLFQSLYMSFCTVEVSPNGIHNVFKGLANYMVCSSYIPTQVSLWHLSNLHPFLPHALHNQSA